MINKIKDFLKNKLGRKRSSELSDQDEIEGQEADAEGEEEEYEAGEAGGDELPEHTGEHHLDMEPAPGLKDRLLAPLLALKSKFKKTPKDDEGTGEFPLERPESGGWRDRLAGLRERLQNLSFRRGGLPKVKPLKLSGAKKETGAGLKLLSPSLGQNIEKLLGKSSREPIHQIFLVVLISIVTYSLGKITALALKGTPALDSARDYAVSIPFERDFNPATLGQVRSINIFRTDRGLGGKKKLADTKCEEARQPSSLPIKLVNTVVLQDSVKSLASVQVRGDRSLQEVREGDQISNLAKIFKIGRLAIVIKNLENGVCESIASDKVLERGRPISVLSPEASRQFKAARKMPGIENVGNKFTIQKSLIDEKMKDIGSILTQARAIKIQNPDGTMAFKLTEMDPEGIFPYLGLQDQDIITSINGKPIYDMNEVMGLFAKIKNLDQLSLGIRREGSESVQEYNIKK